MGECLRLYIHPAGAASGITFRQAELRLREPALVLLQRHLSRFAADPESRFLDIDVAVEVDLSGVSLVIGVICLKIVVVLSDLHAAKKMGAVVALIQHCGIRFDLGATGLACFQWQDRAFVDGGRIAVLPVQSPVDTQNPAVIVGSEGRGGNQQEGNQPDVRVSETQSIHVVLGLCGLVVGD